MPRKAKKSAADRTMEIAPAIMKRQDNLAPPSFDVDGPTVNVIALAAHFADKAKEGDVDGPYITPCNHFIVGGDYTLCDLLVTSYDPVVDARELGTCQQCRVVASQRRMVVKR